MQWKIKTAFFTSSISDAMVVRMNITFITSTGSFLYVVINPYAALACKYLRASAA